MGRILDSDFGLQSPVDGMMGSFMLILHAIKVTRHLCFKDKKDLQLLDVQACNSANKAAFQNQTKSLFVRFGKDGLLAELKARMS